MISGSPSLIAHSLSDGRPSGVDSFLRRHAEDYWYYGSGKVALRDGLSVLATADGNVLFPSYIPDAVVEPARELGLEPRFYAIDADLSPDVADVESRIDDRTAAVLSVDYFGFPNPGLEDFSRLCGEYGCYHVDDNAHAPLSVDDDALLGTRGDLGFTSLRKLFPIPDGAVLYVTDDEIAEGFTPSRLGRPNDRFTARDWLFACKTLAADAFDGRTPVKRWAESLLADRDDGGVAGPRERYEGSKTRMSKLSLRVVEDADPAAIRTRRRANYRVWARLLAGRTDVELLFPDLPPGICPQVCPVRAETPDRFRRELDRNGVGGVYAWPRLPRGVLETDDYETATRLSREVLALPVHQHLDERTLEAVCRPLSRGPQ